LASSVASILNEYVTERGLRFVDRRVEATWILEEAASRWAGDIIVLYGPKGCGKTTLFRALSWATSRLKLEEGGYEVVVAEYNPRDGTVRVQASQGLLESIRGTLAKLLGRVELEIGLPQSLKVGVTLGKRENPHMVVASTLVDAVVRSPRRGARYVVVVDEYRVADIELFKSSLEVDANTVRGYNWTLRQVAESSLTLIVATSDAFVVEARSGGSKFLWALIWNLPREASEELVDQLGLVDRLSGELRELGVEAVDSRELLWRLAGGNPRALEWIEGVGVKAWLEGEVLQVVKSYARRLGWSTFLKHAERLASDPDELSYTPKLWQTAVKLNLALEVGGTVKLTELPREPWIGRDYAYQLPAYWHAVKAVAKRKTLKVEPRDVVEEAMKS